MMDELELLKKDWQSKDVELPKLTYNEIYTMIWKKSSSIVKWILIISILEFVVPHLLYLHPSTRQSLEVYFGTGFSKYLLTFTLIQYGVICYFIFQFYTRYKEISVLDNAKNLMRKIIKTRRTVKHYVIFSLSMILLMVLLMMVGIYFNDDFMNKFPIEGSDDDIDPENLKIALIVGVGIIGVFMVIVMGLVYFLLYGLLLQKLKKNYSELRSLEI